MRSAVVVFCGMLGAMVLSGCVVHRAQVTVPADAPGVNGGTYLGEQRHAPGPTQQAVATGPLPQTILVTAWRWQVAADGRTELIRDDAGVYSPEPWWSRFPFDAPADFIPVDFTARREVTVAYTPVPDRPGEEVAAEAQAAGFFRPVVPPPAAP